jgi:NADPH2:quinone reductase
VRAAVCPVHGPPEVVTVTDLPAPAVGPGEVRVQVAAAAVNFPDVLIPPSSPAASWPEW